MQKQKPFDFTEPDFLTIKELPLKERVLLPFKALFSFAAFLICLLGLVTPIPNKLANPLAVLLISIVYLFSALDRFKTGRIVSYIYMLVFLITLMLSIGGLSSYFIQ